MEPEYRTFHTFAIRRTKNGRADFDVIGKLVLLTSPRVATPTVVLHRKFGLGGAAMRKEANSLSFDERLFYRAREMGAAWIDYEASGKLYRLDFDEFLSLAVPKDYGEGEQLYVPLAHWHVVPEGPYKTQWRREIDEVLPPRPKAWVPIATPKAPTPSPQGTLL